MAKSIYEILETKMTETSVPSQGVGVVIEHSLPEGLFPTAEQFENKDDLLEWAEEQGFTHAIMQRGIQKFLIEVRATFKGCKKDDTWDKSYGRSNVNEMEWSVIKRPGQGKNNEAIAKAVLQETVTNMQLMVDVAKLDKEAISLVLVEKFDDQTDIIETILTMLNFSE